VKSLEDPSVFAEATVTVVRPGPRLSWTPNNLAVTAEGADGAIEEVQSVGRLLDIYGKDIQVYDGDYIEGQHYSIRRVDNLNNSLLGGDVTVTGDPEAGTITVTLSGNVQGANGGTVDKGPIGITLYPSVLTGNDASVIDLEGPGAEMVFNVKSSLLIEDLKDVNTIAKPLHSSTAAPAVGAALGNPESVTNPRFTGTVTGRTGLSSGAYTYREPATVTIELSPETATADYKFYPPAFADGALIKAKFSAGSPEVSNVKATPAKISFTLTYKITAKTIKKTVSATSVAANFAAPLKGLIVDDLVKHGEIAPTALLVQGESEYYALDQAVTWEGLVQNAFFGGKTATATVTIPAKPGYTFTGTDIVADDDDEAVQDLKALFTSEDGETEPVVDIVSAGDSLVFKVQYYVPKAPINGTMIGKYIAPKDKLAVPVLGATVPKTLKIDTNAPFTLDSFSINSSGKYVPGELPIVMVSLLAKDGYEFDGDVLAKNELLPVGAIAVGQQGSVTYNLVTKLTVTITYMGLPATVTNPATGWVLQSPAGLTDPAELVYQHDKHEFTASVLGTDAQVKAISDTAGGSVFEWTSGLTADDKYNYTAAVNQAVATVTLVPKTGYTFYGYSTGADTTAKIKSFFTIGTDADAKAPTVGTPRIDGHNLVFTLAYPISKAKIAGSTITMSTFEDFTAFTAGSAPSNDFGLDSAVTNMEIAATPAPAWTGLSGPNGTSGNLPSTSGSIVTYTFTLVPKVGYEFDVSGGFSLGSISLTNWDTAAIDGTATANSVSIKLSKTF
jgi:hypothetical protein